jgi:hypothetical protein
VEEVVDACSEEGGETFGADEDVEAAGGFGRGAKIEKTFEEAGGGSAIRLPV